MKGKFTAEVQSPTESIPHTIEGTFEFKNIIPPKTPYKDYSKYYFSTMPEIQSSLGKDTLVKNRIVYSIQQSINLSIQVVDRIHFEHTINNKYSKVSYLGLADNCHFFRIVYTISSKDLSSSQILLSVNKDNKEIETADFYPALRNYTGSLEKRLMTSSIYQKFILKQGKKAVSLYVPKEIEYNDKFKDNFMVNLILSDISIF